VLMQTKIVVANVIGQEVIDGNSYPVPSSRVYSSPLKARSGYTVAIAGLDEATDSRSGSGVPVLSRIPVLGWAFKNRYKDRTRKNLMIFITPTIIAPDGRGIGETPVSELPRYADDMPSDAPVFYTTGELQGGPEAVSAAVVWADREERRLRTICREGRGTPETSVGITSLGKILNQLQAYTAAVAEHDPAAGEVLAVRRLNIDALSKRTWSLRTDYFRNSVHTPGLRQL
jgi:hypothetical protein